jgi:hypothetical protein
MQTEILTAKIILFGEGEGEGECECEGEGGEGESVEGSCCLNAFPLREMMADGRLSIEWLK